MLVKNLCNNINICVKNKLKECRKISLIVNYNQKKELNSCGNNAKILHLTLKD
jgi:hypothetical protein